MARKTDKLDKEDVQPEINDQEDQAVGKMQKTDINALEIDMEHHVFIGGITQSGKSFFMKHLFDSMPRAGRRCIFFDYKSDPNHTGWMRKNKYPVFKTIRAIERYWSTTRKQIMFWQDKPKSKVIYRPDRPKGFAGAFEMLNELAEYVFVSGNMILFVDEIAPLTTPQRIPPSLYDCLVMGAARGVTIISVSQRPKDIHNVIISESYTKILFRLNLENDRKKVEGFSDPNVAIALKRIPNKHFIIVFADGSHNTCMINAKPGEK
jgi:hypothetical protein